MDFNTFLIAQSLGSFASEKRVPKKEKHRQDPNQWPDLAIASGPQFDERVSEEPETEARGNAEAQGHGHHGYESGKRVR